MICCALSLAACGKKPPHVDLPEDAAGDDSGKGNGFPHIYPNPEYNK